MKVARQLGYKSVKYISHITVTDSMKHIGDGLGSPGPGSRLLLVRRHLRQSRVNSSFQELFGQV